MKIIADNKIPYLRGVFDAQAEVVYLPGADIRREHLLDADCLLVRTRTRCDRTLLENTNVRFIGTATIGFDHIDTRWCEENNIIWTNAPGCNSGSVSQYITAALLEMSGRLRFPLSGKTLGIIGVGHVGTKVERIARHFGMNVLLNDPPRARVEGPSSFTSLTALLNQSDIVTIHVPLNQDGPDKTHGMVDSDFIKSLKRGAVLINSSRGEVIDEQAVIRQKKANPEVDFSLVLDVWPNEPQLNRELLTDTTIATPHIAGYSADGKFNATRMMIEAVSRVFGIIPGPMPGSLEEMVMELEDSAGSVRQIADYVKMTYDILADDRKLRASPETFEEQRNNYPVRREFAAWAVEPFPGGETGRILAGLGFRQLS